MLVTVNDTTYMVGCFSPSAERYFLEWCAVFSRYAPENRTQKICRHLAAAGNQASNAGDRVIHIND
jgi:hypothetical protein